MSKESTMPPTPPTPEAPQAALLTRVREARQRVEVYKCQAELEQVYRFNFIDADLAEIERELSAAAGAEASAVQTTRFDGDILRTGITPVADALRSDGKLRQAAERARKLLSAREGAERVPMPDEPGFREYVKKDCEAWAREWDATLADLTSALEAQ